MSDKTVKVTGDDAIDLAMSVSSDSSIIESRSGYCCDSGWYGGDKETESDVSWFFWTLLLYRNQADRITIKFTENQFGQVDWSELVWVWIETGDVPEPSTTQFRIVPPNYGEDEFYCANCQYKLASENSECENGCNS